MQANFKHASIDPVMKIINSFENEHDAREHLTLEGYTELYSHKYGTVFKNKAKYVYLVLRNFRGRWEVQQPEIENQKT